MIGAALESQSPTERASAARLIVAELSEGPKTQGWACTCASAPGQFCPQEEPHGYRSTPKTVGLSDLLIAAIESNMVVCGSCGSAKLVVDGVPVALAGAPGLRSRESETETVSALATDKPP